MENFVTNWREEKKFPYRLASLTESLPATAITTLTTMEKRKRKRDRRDLSCYLYNQSAETSFDY